MLHGHVIALDTHCAFTVAAILNGRGEPPSGRGAALRRLPTEIPALRALLEELPRPRHVVLEEGPLADWLLRELALAADSVVACDPRRNALIAKSGDKDDPIDALKLAQLYRGGFVTLVHHPVSLERAAFKQLVGLYHDRVRNAVRHGNRLLDQFRRHGLFVARTALLDGERRRALLARLPGKALQAGVRVLCGAFEAALADVARLRKLVMREARRWEPVGRFVALPGVMWIRAATFFAYVDTPWRFRSKQALWRYMGIGLERRHSGAGPEQVGVPASVTVCRPLKNMILGAAKSALRGENAFAARYKELLHAGVSPRNAVRTVARSLATTLWGMFKNGDAYHPAWVGQAAAAAAARWTAAAEG